VNEAEERWMIYGANGYTGELIAREARSRGYEPLLAGRNTDAIARLARELGLEAVAVGLEDAPALADAMRGTTLVLHCAGPFSATAAPMMRACLTVGAHYLDITGEIDVFEAAHSLDAEARAAGIVMCPGVGFDVVPTDCVAASLSQALPDATYLALGFEMLSRPSRGTARTTVEGIADGGRIRSSGKIVNVDHAFRERKIDFGNGDKLATTIPWGDVSTAFYTTGIPNIEVYTPVPAARLKAMRRLNAIRPLLRLGFVQSLLKRQASRGQPGPDAAARARTPSFVWGEVQAPSGEQRTGRIRVGNGYDVTVHAALGIVERLFDYSGEGGYYTPSLLVGPQFVERLPDSTSIEITPGRAWEPKPQ